MLPDRPGPNEDDRTHTRAAFDWWLLEYLRENDPVAPGLLVYELDEDRELLEDRLHVLRERGLAKFYFSSRPTQWGLTEEGRSCLGTSMKR